MRSNAVETAGVSPKLSGAPMATRPHHRKPPCLDPRSLGLSDACRRLTWPALGAGSLLIGCDAADAQGVLPPLLQSRIPTPERPTLGRRRLSRVPGV